VKIKAIEIEFFSRNDEATYYHVLADGDTVGDLTRYRDVWKFASHAVMVGGRYTGEQRTQIYAAAKKKETLLNITWRLTK